MDQTWKVSVDNKVTEIVTLSICWLMLDQQLIQNSSNLPFRIGLESLTEVLNVKGYSDYLPSIFKIRGEFFRNWCPDIIGEYECTTRSTDVNPFIGMH